MLEGKTVLVGITGGIAAYKICTLIRLLKKSNANVKVVVTPSALNFVTKLTLQSLSQNEVYVDNFEIDSYKPEHIALTEADLFVIAPLTANSLSKIANGISDNLLLSTACAFQNQMLLVPAMNTGMWNNNFVQDNIKKLINNGYHILEPAEGFLACGTNGKGRMVEVEDIYNKVVEILTQKQILKGKKILITAGGTKEPIDPVRYISNCSSGKMGIALADTAYEMGAEVTLVSTFGIKKPYRNIVAESAINMREVVTSELENNDTIIMAAAVSDYRVANYSDKKIKKTSEDCINLELVKNPDILQEISNKKTDTIIVGFCAESEHLLENAKKKIQKKGCDYIIANDISRKDIGFSSNENEVYIINKNLEVEHIEKDTKKNISKKILEKIFE